MCLSNIFCFCCFVLRVEENALLFITQGFFWAFWSTYDYIYVWQTTPISSKIWCHSVRTFQWKYWFIYLCTVSFTQSLVSNHGAGELLWTSPHQLTDLYLAQIVRHNFAIRVDKILLSDKKDFNCEKKSNDLNTKCLSRITAKNGVCWGEVGGWQMNSSAARRPATQIRQTSSTGAYRLAQQFRLVLRKTV